MKKFTSGLLCGVVLSLSTVTFADAALQTIEAYIFPSKISFQMNGNQTQLDTTENTVLNYNNKTYIPLRAFAENMGARVDYLEPSKATDNLNHITISSNEYTLKNYETSTPPANAVCSPASLSLQLPEEYRLNSDSLAIESTNNFTYAIGNSTNDTAVHISPFTAAIEVYTASEGSEGQLVYRSPLPPHPGSIPAHSAYILTVPWSQIGLDGKKIKPGPYIVKLAVPDNINYTIEGNDELKSSPTKQTQRCGLIKYLVNYK